MKKSTLLSLSILALTFACGPNAEELAAREKAKMDSVAKATEEAIAAKAIEDSINRVRQMEADAARIADSLANEITKSIENESCKELRAQLNAAEDKLNDIKGFKIGRTAAEKEAQLTAQYKLIEDLKDALKDCD